MLGIGIDFFSRRGCSPPSDSNQSSNRVVRQTCDGAQPSANAVATVLLAGQYQNGKSTLINCLLGGEYAIEGDGCHTTAYRTKYTATNGAVKYFKIDAFGKRTEIQDGLVQSVCRNGGAANFEVQVPSPALESMSLIDAPGWGAEDADDLQAEKSLENIDYVIYMAQSKQLSQEDKNFLRLLKKRRKYFCVLLNVRDATDPAADSLQDVCAAIAGAFRQLEVDDQFIRYPSDTGICIVNLLWAKFGLRLLDNPKTQRERQQGAVVRMAWGENPCDERAQIDYKSVLSESGYFGWRIFFESTTKFIKKFGVPSTCAIHDAVSSSICANLINIIRRG